MTDPDLVMRTFEELERQMGVLTRQMTVICQEVAKVAAAYGRAASLLAAEGNARALARVDVSPEVCVAGMGPACACKGCAAERAAAEIPPAVSRRQRKRLNAERDSYRARGGYASVGPPITQLPPVPPGPAPGATRKDQE